jgi:hypothetical protein
MLTAEEVLKIYSKSFQEFYKLIIINTITNCASLSKYPAFYYLLNKKTEVDLPSTLMSLIYFQVTSMSLSEFSRVTLQCSSDRVHGGSVFLLGVR